MHREILAGENIDAYIVLSHVMYHNVVFLFSKLHNLDWEVAVGHHLGLTPEQSLVLLMEPDKIPADLLSKVPEHSSSWTPDMIMKDFEGDDFFQMMYNFNKAIC